MTIDNTLLDNLTERAKASERLRMNYDLRDSAEEDCQRMLNAIEPGTVIPIHRHLTTSEDVIALRGRAEEVFFDETGAETGRWTLTPGGSETGSVAAIQIPARQYHTLRSLEPGTVIFECKSGRHNPAVTDEFLPC